MHQVKERRMPLLRTATGCRWRKTLLMTAITRVRRSRGTPWRKTEFQTCELRTQLRGPERRGISFLFSISDLRFSIGDEALNQKSKIKNRKFLSFLQCDKAFGVLPLAQFRA